MKIIFITHASAEAVEPRGSFRPLSNQGLSESGNVAGAVAYYLKKYGLKKIDALISSSAVRCVHTIFTVANILRTENEILIGDRIIATDTLNEKEDEAGKKIPLSFGRLKHSINEAGLVNSELILLSVHGDFASIFPQSKIYKEEIDVNGFFKSKPITGVLHYSPDAESFSENDILECDKCCPEIRSIIH